MWKTCAGRKITIEGWKAVSFSLYTRKYFNRKNKCVATKIWDFWIESVFVASVYLTVFLFQYCLYFCHGWLEIILRENLFWKNNVDSLVSVLLSYLLIGLIDYRFKWKTCVDHKVTFKWWIQSWKAVPSSSYICRYLNKKSKYIATKKWDFRTESTFVALVFDNIFVSRCVSLSWLARKKSDAEIGISIRRCSWFVTRFCGSVMKCRSDLPA